MPSRTNGGSAGAVLGFLIEIIFQIVFEAIFEGLFYAIRRLWFGLTGQKDKARDSLDSHRIAQDARRKNIERIRRERKKGG